MASPSITVVADPHTLAERAADALLDFISAAIDARGVAFVALAGGSTPRTMNQMLATAPRRDRVDWSRVRFAFGDERCVPPDHPDSNYRMTRETLFDPLGIDAAAVFRIRGEDEPHRAAEEYEALLRATLGDPPIFDAIALGMGPDGHTASLFPGTLATIDERRSVVANFVPKFDAYRVTITPRVLTAARAVMITAAGAEKAGSLKAVLEGPPEPNRYPAQLVLGVPSGGRWFVDAAAAAELSTTVTPVEP